MPRIRLSIGGAPRTLDTDAETFDADLTTALADVRTEERTATETRLSHATTAHTLLVGEIVRLSTANAIARGETAPDAAEETAYLAGLDAVRLEREWKRAVKDVPAPAPATVPGTTGTPTSNDWV